VCVWRVCGGECAGQCSVVAAAAKGVCVCVSTPVSVRRQCKCDKVVFQPRCSVVMCHERQAAEPQWWSLAVVVAGSPSKVYKGKVPTWCGVQVLCGM